MPRISPRMLTARRAAEIQPFEVMDVLSRAHALEAQGRRVVHMEIGEPDFTAPTPVVEAGVRAVRDGLTAYTATLGLPALREAIAGHYEERLGARVPASRIAVTAGASGALLTVAALYVDAGDEILVPDPGYPGYRHFVRAFEGVAKSLPVSAASAFQPTLEMVRAAWGPRSKGLLLGTPSNPTGTLISHDELRRIAGFIAEQGGVLLVDEIYQGLVYGEAPWTALALPGDVVVINSFSKYFCMTGWRLGWVVLPERAVREFEKLAQHLFISASAAAQHAAIAAFSPESISTLEARRAEFAARRDFLLPQLRAAGLKIPVEPRGAFYVYAECGSDSRTFARELLEKEAVASTPGVDFGTYGTERHVRFAYTRSREDLAEAAQRIKRFAACVSAA
ncbi:MAG TPA: pyridoxal phosphate-dependent aminotransferase [Burkholderiales bacterium]|nr:pyridoxal phosphate-dependent aminotransferase [Burkholderiales bacterium]